MNSNPMPTAICYYYNGKLLRNSIVRTIANPSSILTIPGGYVQMVNVLENKLGVFHSRVFKTPFKPISFEHITRTPETEPEFTAIEALQNTEGLTDIFKVSCEKDPNLHSDENLMISDNRTEYYVGFFILVNMHGGYEDLQTLIDFYVNEGWTRSEVIETIKRFVTYDYSLEPWHYARHFDKLRKVAQKNLELLGLESLPELIMGSDNDNSVAA